MIVRTVKGRRGTETGTEIGIVIVTAPGTGIDLHVVMRGGKALQDPEKRSSPKRSLSGWSRKPWLIFSGRAQNQRRNWSWRSTRHWLLRPGRSARPRRSILSAEIRPRLPIRDERARVVCVSRAAVQERRATPRPLSLGMRGDQPEAPHEPGIATVNASRSRPAVASRLIIEGATADRCHPGASAVGLVSGKGVIGAARG